MEKEDIDLWDSLGDLDIQETVLVKHTVTLLGPDGMEAVSESIGLPVTYNARLNLRGPSVRDVLYHLKNKNFDLDCTVNDGGLEDNRNRIVKSARYCGKFSQYVKRYDSNVMDVLCHFCPKGSVLKLSVELFIYGQLIDDGETFTPGTGKLANMIGGKPAPSTIIPRGGGGPL